jgi:hypothetical protein
MQGILRGVGDPAVRAREAMHSVLLFEDSPQRFRKIFSRTRAVEFFFHFLGLVLAAWCVRWMVAHAIAAPLNKGLVAAGVVLLLSAVCFAYFFREHAPRTRGPAPLVWRDLLRPNLPAPLWIMAGGMCIFSLAISTSHCFALQWFFQEKFGASNSDILIVGALHRLFVAIPLLVAGHFIRRRLKFWLVLLVACEGVFVAAPGFMPAADYALVGVRVSALWTAVGVWLLHDVLGMGAWLSAQQELVQRYSRPETRGKDVSLTGALAAVGGIGGPLLAGWLRTWNVFGDGFAVNLPFIVSGMLASTAAIVLLALPDVRSRPT